MAEQHAPGTGQLAPLSAQEARCLDWTPLRWPAASAKSFVVVGMQPLLQAEAVTLSRTHASRGPAIV